MLKRIKADKINLQRGTAIILFAVISAILILTTRAATPTASLEAEQGSAVSGASIVMNSTGASGNKHIAFSAANNPAPGQFYIVGKDIIAPDGSKFLPVGTNTISTSYWFWLFQPSHTWTNEYKAWNFNIVRLPEYFAGNHFAGDDSTKLAQLDTYVQKFTAEKIVVLIDWHDIVFGTWPTAAQNTEAATWWANIANRYKNNPYVWFELINEPGAPNDGALQDNRWINLHQEHINAIRGTGSENLIWVMGSDWGQDSLTKIIPAQGQQLKGAQCNIGFSFHNYNQWSSASNLTGYVNSIHAKGLALLLTESGFHMDGAYVEGWPPATVEQSVRNYYTNLPQLGVGILDFTGMSALNSKYSLVTKVPNPSPADEAARYGHFYKINSLTNPTNLTPVGTLLWNLAHNKPNLGAFSGNLAASNCASAQ